MHVKLDCNMRIMLIVPDRSLASRILRGQISQAGCTAKARLLDQGGLQKFSANQIKAWGVVPMTR